jgi:hypothetical protein
LYGADGSAALRLSSSRNCMCTAGLTRLVAAANSSNARNSANPASSARSRIAAEGLCANCAAASSRSCCRRATTARDKRSCATSFASEHISCPVHWCALHWRDLHWCALHWCVCVRVAGRTEVCVFFCVEFFWKGGLEAWTGGRVNGREPACRTARRPCLSSLVCWRPLESCRTARRTLCLHTLVVPDGAGFGRCQRRTRPEVPTAHTSGSANGAHVRKCQRRTPPEVPTAHTSGSANGAHVRKCHRRTRPEVPTAHTSGSANGAHVRKCQRRTRPEVPTAHSERLDVHVA